MKRKLFVIIPALTVVFLLTVSFSGDEQSDYQGGSPAGYTGSPGDGHNCVACHGGSASTVSGWITSDIPPEGYTPGTTYSITVTVSGSGKKGFEVSPQDQSGAQLGTLIAGTGSKLVGGTKYVTQVSSPSANPSTWTFGWTAPLAGTGTVTIYGAFTVSKSVTKLSTLDISEYNPSTSAISSVSETSCFINPNPACGFLNIQITETDHKPVQIDILNTRGVIVQSEYFRPVTGKQTERIDISGLPDGLYLVRLTAGVSQQIQKLIKY